MTTQRRCGATAIRIERERQVKELGYSRERDQYLYGSGELFLAALCYAPSSGNPNRNEVPTLWPWDARHWCPSDDSKRNLEKAGALLLAEVDRLSDLALEWSGRNFPPSDVLLFAERSLLVSRDGLTDEFVDNRPAGKLKTHEVSVLLDILHQNIRGFNDTIGFLTFACALLAAEYDRITRSER